MKTKKLAVLAVAAMALMGFQTTEVHAQTGIQHEPKTFARRNLSGPRLGTTYVLGGEILLNDMEEEGMGRLVSQFGWHFEYQVIPEGGGPQFVVQIVPFLAGVEYGKILPSTTLAMGIRFPSGFEIGMGPELMVGKGGLKTALVLGIGKSLNYGGVSIPINLAFTKNNDGTRISIIFGYAIAKAR